MVREKKNSSFTKTSLLILKISSVGFIAAACYHLLAIFIKLNDSTGWRNMLFVLINLWCALEIRRTKKYFLILFTVLFVQQIISHGNSVIDNLKDHRFDWFGVFVLTAITIIYFTWIISAIVKLQSQARAKDVG